MLAHGIVEEVGRVADESGEREGRTSVVTRDSSNRGLLYDIPAIHRDIYSSPNQEVLARRCGLVERTGAARRAHRCNGLVEWKDRSS